MTTAAPIRIMGRHSERQPRFAAFFPAASRADASYGHLRPSEIWSPRG